MIFSSICHAKTVAKSNILGLWHIIDFKIICKNGVEKDWADDIFGTLVYTDSNFMSVSINGQRNKMPVVLFYSGTYAVLKGNIIKHMVHNATDPNRINKTMTRYVNYKHGVLTLTAYGEYGKAIIRWKKNN